VSARARRVAFKARGAPERGHLAVQMRVRRFLVGNSEGGVSSLAAFGPLNPSQAPCSGHSRCTASASLAALGFWRDWTVGRRVFVCLRLMQRRLHALWE